MIDQFLKA